MKLNATIESQTIILFRVSKNQVNSSRLMHRLKQRSPDILFINNLLLWKWLTPAWNLIPNMQHVQCDAVPLLFLFNVSNSLSIFLRMTSLSLASSIFASRLADSTRLSRTLVSTRSESSSSDSAFPGVNNEFIFSKSDNDREDSWNEGIKCRINRSDMSF